MSNPEISVSYHLSFPNFLFTEGKKVLEKLEREETKLSTSLNLRLPIPSFERKVECIVKLYSFLFRASNQKPSLNMSATDVIGATFAVRSYNILDFNLSISPHEFSKATRSLG